MARLTKDEQREILIKAGVTLHGDELWDELQGLIDALPEQAPEPNAVKSSELVEPETPEEPTAPVPEAEASVQPPVDNEHVEQGAEQFDTETVAANADPGTVTRVIFHMNDVVVKTREFTLQNHGEGFLTIAADFAKTNARKIRSREDL